MKLEIKHIAPYLPYGLECDKGKVYGFTTGKDDVAFIECDHTEFYPLEEIKPLLNPLSKLTEQDVKVIALREGIHIENVIKYIRIGIVNYRTMQMIFEQKYDVFGLIDNGLAEVKG